MKRQFCVLTLLFVCLSLTALQTPVNAQDNQNKDAKEVYTGTVVAIGGMRGGASATFNLTLVGRTTDEEALRFLNILAKEGQDGLLKALKKERHGSFSVGGQLGRDLYVVRESRVEGSRRIFAVFERWIKFAEARGGYRSQDYPLGIIEIFIDEKGKGEGTYIAAAKVKIDRDEETEKVRLEIENFGTYPAKLMGVTSRGKK